MRLRILPASLIFLLVACDQTHSPSKDVPVHVGISTLHSEAVTLFTQLPGRTTAVRTAEVRPQVSGIILKRLFTEGSEVKAGQSLYQIDPATYQATYDKAMATLINADKVAARYKPLAAAHAISQQVYDDAVATAREARADVETARVNLNYTKVRAPISGHIGRSLTTEGALVTNGQSSYMSLIQQLDPIYVDVNASSRDLLAQRRALADGRLKKAGDNAAAVKLTLEDGSAYPLEGRMEFSEVTVDESTGSVTLRASFPNPQRNLLPGMFVHASFAQGIAEQGILVPQQSVMHDIKGRPYVYVVNTENRIREQLITTGQMIGQKWLVHTGLKEGDRVVVDGLQNVQPGTRVTASVSSGKSQYSSKVNLAITDASAQ
ncbi:efflux RND transporter periplasmic adaptor subunit [Erwinia sorbitola]|uniref:Efflux RND transporter periplasmic adaptor subunit n=1 Tax=Erwinia sorbitola TaxID=2681984 RepID=A0A6I6ECR2_9GAMM|nr:efflux RND transporter periplasmic adaptor subunit [Erwinia sorbitola]QGU86428.1 efflux RND transporter periplasmic adaptor subunit [Erwinia sorbitola]